MEATLLIDSDAKTQRRKERKARRENLDSLGVLEIISDLVEQASGLLERLHGRDAHATGLEF